MSADGHSEVFPHNKVRVVQGWGKDQAGLVLERLSTPRPQLYCENAFCLGALPALSCDTDINMKTITSRHTDKCLCSGPRNE